jgi:toxin-antitoxin system PIN domain toxin
MTDTRRFLLDVNTLVALSLGQHVHHKAAHEWFGSLTKEDVWLTTPFTEAAFLRLLMNPNVAGTTVNFATAVSQLQAMKTAARTPHQFLRDQTSLASPVLSAEGLRKRIVGRAQITDFHLLNLAVDAGAQLATFDQKLFNSLPSEWQHHLNLITVGRKP